MQGKLPCICFRAVKALALYNNINYGLVFNVSSKLLATMVLVYIAKGKLLFLHIAIAMEYIYSFRLSFLEIVLGWGI